MATTKTAAKKTAKKKTAAKTPAKKTAKKKAASQGGSGEGNTQLEKFFVDSLRDILWAEKALTKSLPRLQKAATTPELKEALQMHVGQTQEQISRLEEVFGIVQQKVQAKKCEAMEGLIAEGQSIVEETETGSKTRDVGIIMACQKVEHYEIATYGGLVQLATVLGLSDAADLLAETLEEEKQTDLNLTDIAENSINWEAEQEDEEEDDDEEAADDEEA